MSKFMRINPPSNNLHEKYSAPPSFVSRRNFAKRSSAPYDGETKKERNAILVERRAMRLLSRCYSDGHGLQIFGNWNQRWSSELRGARSGKSSGTGIDTVF
ncbi:uncharacterized protein LOC105429389 [Pogonomyrmex barbatus]|uniref:Uncharacterized protein LOC105429389 n=1 Tax=Pogonomyrmex barbatus TaxID=144034 RepID=A0A6I9WM60_9HYME|nr:uncharacterized protein LOC105429389 [Pogonomyrmex barbatus]